MLLLLDALVEGVCTVELGCELEALAEGDVVEPVLETDVALETDVMLGFDVALGADVALDIDVEDGVLVEGSVTVTVVSLATNIDCGCGVNVLSTDATELISASADDKTES